MDLQQIVRDWQTPLYNLAYRLLGNEADAADATQEIFASLIRSLRRYDPRRPFRPWIYSVARNALRNRIRDAQTRRELEARVAAREEPFEEEPVMERIELEAAVRRELSRLPEECRGAIVLQYYQGLSQSEAAEVLAIPRTTLQSRIERGLKRMREGLAGSGMAAAAPHLESFMQATAPLAVPPALSASLAGMAVAAGAGATAAQAVTFGGLMMTKQFVLAAAVAVVAFSLGTGYLAGRSSVPDAGAGSGARGAAMDAGAATPDAEQVRAENQRLSTQVRTLEEENRRLLAAAALREVEPPPASQTDSRSARAPDRAATGGIEWDRFAELVAANRELIARLEGPDRGEGLTPTPEERGRLLELEQEFQRVAAQAHQLSAAPIFDPRILPGLVEAMFGKSLAMSPEQLQTLRDQTQALLARATTGFDPATALPIESWDRRQQLTAGIMGAVPQMLRDEQKPGWDQLSSSFRHPFDSDQSVVQVPLGRVKDGLPPEAQVVREWGRGYGLDAGQQEAAQSLAQEFVAEARRIVHEIRDPERQQQALLAVQIEKERSLYGMLRADQRAAARRHFPIVIRLNNRGESGSSTRRGGMGL